MRKEHVALSKIWAAGKFEPVIRHIRFPYFRNLSEDFRIEFTHPIVALVGHNGTNKSSILRAIQGCPEDQNIGRFWFGTPMDVIPEGERHRFIHGRWSESAKKVVEVIQIRRPRRRQRSASYSPDYFESAGPRIGDGMEEMPPSTDPMAPDRVATRWKAVQKEVEYFDFRAEISAFDKYFYHNDANIRGRSLSRYDEQLRTRKEFLRDKSSTVIKLLERRVKSFKPGGKEIVVEPSRALDSGELDAIGYILGREYEQIDIVTHRAFRATGTTARMVTKNFSYSEAWAGSGEFAVLKLVTLVLGCDEKTLLLLDEPEVSLHPGAQERLMEFLVEQVKLKLLQVVIATHSPTIVNTLPAQAVKVLERSPADGKVYCRTQNSSAAEAFVALQHDTKKRTIFVEDRLAREIVLGLLREGGQARMGALDVKIQPGGHTVLRSRSLPIWAAERRSDVLILLDGDQRFNLPEASSGISDDKLESVVQGIMGTKKTKGYVPADTGGPTPESLRNVIDWTRDNLRFLPGKEPDVWLGHAIDPSASICGDGKEWWDDRVRKAKGLLPGERVLSDERFYFQTQFVKSAVSGMAGELADLDAVVEEFLNRP